MDDEPAIHITCVPECRYSFTAYDYRVGHKQCPLSRWHALCNRMRHNAYSAWPGLIWTAVRRGRI